jgi:hypothetical protein
MKEQARQRIGTLMDRFRTNIDAYKKSAYNEAQVRREFIDPFFEALGWDVSNKQGFAEQYKEVVLEDTIKVGRSTRAPDYSFRIGGQRKFFVEAKKPAVNIKEDVSPSYQLRRYAWSAKLPLSIVTDFEEFSVFNCQMKPNQNDKVGIGRVAYFTFDEYLDKFDEIYDVFSKEAVLKGSFDRYAQSTKGKKGTAEVDREFLKEIEGWRELLAKNIALRNPNVSIYELNYAVQKLLDRIIFLRICEDRGIEPYGQLQTQAESGDVYMHLLNHFRLAESKYDSGIFDFDFESDRITPGLTIDDKVLKTIIQDLYYPKSPYEFSVLGVEILGNVYEQFLGKVIRLTAGHQAKVETKPEVKKAGGVYYTPQYIVEYIVENTIGKLIAGKTPEEIAHIKVLDPACGSGSFLIGAYSYLLRYHLDWYVNNKPKKHKEAVFQAKENEWYLTTAEKKRILLDNIFGVDIDSQAVEVTKMSLLLKVLEHESRESIDQQMKLGLEGVLPNLGDNIKCGNSLIGSDYYDLGQQGTLFNEEEMRRVNVFDWDDERKGFGGIMSKGGFDCVVGNPPYIFARDEGFTKHEKQYFKLNKLESESIELHKLAMVKAGLKAYETGKGNPPQTDEMKKNRVYHSKQKLDQSYRVYLDGKDVIRYLSTWSGEYLKYGPNLAAPRDPTLFEGERILVRQIPSLPPYAINAIIASSEELNDINSMIVKAKGEYSLRYILGILNSRLLTLWFDYKFDKFQRAIFPQFKVNELSKFPIRTIDFSNPEEVAKHDKLVALVDNMLELQKKHHDARMEQDKELYERQIKLVDAQIDKQVYDLYGLTEEEIKVVEDG